MNINVQFPLEIFLVEIGLRLRIPVVMHSRKVLEAGPNG